MSLKKCSRVNYGDNHSVIQTIFPGNKNNAFKSSVEFNYYYSNNSIIIELLLFVSVLVPLPFVFPLVQFLPVHHFEGLGMLGCFRVAGVTSELVKPDKKK